MSVLRGYPRVAAIVLLVQYQRQYISHSMKYHVLSERVRQRDVLARRVSFCCVFLGYDIVERGKGQLMFLIEEEKRSQGESEETVVYVIT